MNGLLLVIVCSAGVAWADLRMASRPRNMYGLLNEGGADTQRYVTQNIVTGYMEPSIFRYDGLGYQGGQKPNNYDNFLRSNIDNEQDNRNFEDDAGEDHLPFRSLSTSVDESWRSNRLDGIAGKSKDLRVTVNPGDSMFVPLRWNNPHSSELEVNIWIFQHASAEPLVVPIKKPTCSGEGYQNNIVAFKIPTDFVDLGSRIPGFTGCNQNTDPMCTLQVYAHSVESRQYALGFPIIIPGHDTTKTTASTALIQGVAQDPGVDLNSLRDLCRPQNDPEADIEQARPRWAKLVSDVYTHAYMNSDFSPYSGQQHESISKNLQASAVNKMVTGNRGELGKSILPTRTAAEITRLQNLEDTIYKNYEGLANRIINRLGDQMLETGTVGATTQATGTVNQQLANCFRCQKVGSTKATRQQTNTYIPSFQLTGTLLTQAKAMVDPKYHGLFSATGQVQIYVAAMTDLLPFFYRAQGYGITYQTAMTKDTLTTKADATQFKKRDLNGATDDGVYASTTAKLAYAQSLGCPAECLTTCSSGLYPLIKGTAATCITGLCTACEQLFSNEAISQPPETLISQAASAGTLGSIGNDAIASYPDTDGSPRLGRPDTVSGLLPAPEPYTPDPNPPTPITGNTNPFNPNPAPTNPGNPNPDPTTTPVNPNPAPTNPTNPVDPNPDPTTTSNPVNPNPAPSGPTDPSGGPVTDPGTSTTPSSTGGYTNPNPVNDPGTSTVVSSTFSYNGGGITGGDGMAQVAAAMGRHVSQGTVLLFTCLTIAASWI